MEKSANYHRRKELMARLEVPTIGETMRELGTKMAQILFEQCPEPLKPQVGLLPKLDGPGDELWNSPSDLLIPKVCLKPPLSNKHIKALTHEGILAIGEGIDQKYWAQMEQEKHKALEHQRGLVTRIAEMEHRVAVKLARQNEKEEAAANVENLMQEFEKRLVVELKNLEDHMLAMQDRIIKEAVEECDHSWRVRIKLEINDAIDKMAAKYADDIENEKRELEKQFRMELEKQNTEFNYALKREQEFCQMTLKQLRHCLECKNLANLMYVLCMERRKCAIERCTLEYLFKNQITDLEEKVYHRDVEIRRLTEERNKKQKQLDIREECLMEILKQFQKFINFALKAAPTQAEFLLSVEKMILYEAAKQTWEQGKNAIKHVCKKIMSWKTDSSVTESDTKDDLDPKDYHKCLNEIKPKKGGEESDVLPYFYYRNKMYVRRDLKYYFDQGQQISETNLLWNKDVEDLMQILTALSKKNEGEIKGGDTAECEDKVDDEASNKIKSENEDIPSLTSKQQLKESKTSKHSEGSRKSTVSFQNKLDKQDAQLKPALKAIDDGIQQTVEQSMSSNSPPPYDIPVMDNIGLLAAQDSLATIRMSRKSSTKDVRSNSDMETNQTLTAVKESLQSDNASKKDALADVGLVSFEHFQAIRILDEIELTKPSNRSSKISLGTKAKVAQKIEKESILQKPPKCTKPNSPSKLLQATDSLIIHRNSLVGSHKLQEIMNAVKQQATPGKHFSHGSLISKLSFTKDSLEIIRKQSLHSKKEPSTEEVLLLSKGSLKQITTGPEFQKVQKVVSPLTVSHIEVAKIPTDVKEADVRFSPIHEVYETNLLKTSDSPWNIYREQYKRSAVAPSQVESRPSPKAQIVGKPEGREHLESSEEFTENRITSIMNILKQDSSLLRLFTAARN